MPPILPLLLFLFTYAGLALGRVRRLATDRTGWAMLGATGFLLARRVSFAEAMAAIDAPTLAVLFGMMLLSAQFHQSGAYGALAERLARIENPRHLLLGTIVACAVLSAVLTNDVVCFALTPLVIVVVVRRGQNPLPFLAAVACASNLGGALTPIGNPQNILIAQHLHLHFLPFVLTCATPVVLSLAFLYFLVARRVEPAGAAARGLPLPVAALPPAVAAAAVDRGGAIKAVVLTACAIALFLSPLPAALAALAIAAAVLISRRFSTRDALDQVDWGLLALFVSLFVVQRGIALSGWTLAASNALLHSGVQLSRLVVLMPVTAVLSNMVSNVPAVMLLLPFVEPRAETGYALALAGTFAGNAVLVGSIANLIVAEQAERMGIRFGFAEHLRVGLPVTLVSLALAAGSLALIGTF